jgi:tRNA-2-methylthio-N6-dimethylallyladenosine synthase
MSFLQNKQNNKPLNLVAIPKTDGPRKLYIETYGCQMNVNDSEVVASVLAHGGFSITKDMKEADVILINTCSIRDNAEVRVRGRLQQFRVQKQRRRHVVIGVIGCMAERLKEQLLNEEKMVDIVAGPDAYRDLPRLIEMATSGNKAVNVILSAEETYADITPVRMDDNKISSFVAIMRGCNNFCTYCVVPYTRGRERSRSPRTIVNEVKQLFEDGYREVTLLGQNVNSYHWDDDGVVVDFPGLMARVAQVSPLMRVRFATSHPKDMSDKLLETIAQYPNLCKNIHLPAQSGSTRMLELMNRKYTREQYLERVAAVRRILPEASISTDIIAGFCGETEEDHKQTLTLMEEAGYELAFMFQYSERPGTYSSKNMKDDVPEEVKSRRLSEIIELQRRLSHQIKKNDVGKTFEVLVEGVSKKSKADMFGRTSQNNVVIFPHTNQKVGDYVKVRIVRCSSATLFGELVD